MKSGIHPTMHQDATITCSTCKTVYTLPCTKPEISVEVCRMCHPAYTGKKQTDHKGGRVERFRQRMAAAETIKNK
jgi:large subunit ribosomal protein L31